MTWNLGMLTGCLEEDQFSHVTVFFNKRESFERNYEQGSQRQ